MKTRASSAVHWCTLLVLSAILPMCSHRNRGEAKAVASTCPTREVSAKVIREHCGDPAIVKVLRNSEGAIGAYVLQPTVMDSPIPYLDCNGEPLTVFHIFAPDAEKQRASAIIDPIRSAYPVEEPLRCTATPAAD